MNQALPAELKQPFTRLPRQRSALWPVVADAIDPLLDQLEHQQRWRYGLPACGHVLQLALVESTGPQRQLWELRLGRWGQLELLRDDGLRLSGAQFAVQLQENRCVD